MFTDMLVFPTTQLRGTENHTAASGAAELRPINTSPENKGRPPVFLYMNYYFNVTF